MPESRIIFDAVESSSGQSTMWLAIVLSVGFPSLLLFFSVRGFSKASSKSAKTLAIILGSASFLLLLIGVGSLVSDPLSNSCQQHINNSDYVEVSGDITKLTESTLLAGNPSASFEVAGHVFEYGRGTPNYELDMIGKGGVLANGHPVRIWFKDDKILRMFSVGDESK
ncbi:MAG: hypothetical protein RRC34_00850 [Lentisphaeria bacterium]|nr:hypothetical protein [Lentisphaeria bacterium]